MTGNGLAAHFALYAGCITNCIFGGFETEEMLLKWLFCEVCGLQALCLWPAAHFFVVAHPGNDGQADSPGSGHRGVGVAPPENLQQGIEGSGYLAAGERRWQISAKRKRKPN